MAKTYLQQKQEDSYIKWLTKEIEEAQDLEVFAQSKADLAAEEYDRTRDHQHLELRARWEDLKTSCDVRAAALIQNKNHLPAELRNQVYPRKAAYSRGRAIYLRDFT